MEQNLKYTGLAMPSLNGGDKPHWSSVAGNIMGSLASLGLSASQVIAATRGNQPIVVTNPKTGETQNITPALKDQQQNMGDAAFQQMLMMQMMQQQGNNKPSMFEGDTLLYIGVGAAALIVLMIAMNKK